MIEKKAHLFTFVKKSIIKTNTIVTFSIFSYQNIFY